MNINNFHPLQPLSVNTNLQPPPLLHHLHHPPHQNTNSLPHGMPPFISRNPTFQHFINPYTSFDQMYSTQNPHLLATYPHAVHVSPYSTLEGLLNLLQTENPPTPLPILIKERLTNSLIRLASTQLELTQELTTLEFYYLLHHPSALPNLSMQHLMLILQLNNFVNSSLHQILGMQQLNESNEETIGYEEDEDIEEQVVPQMPEKEPTFPMPHQATQVMEEEGLNILDPQTQTLHLKEPLTLDMLKNIERKYIKFLQYVKRVTINMRNHNLKIDMKYVVLFIPSTKDKKAGKVEGITNKEIPVNLDMTLSPGGSSSIQVETSMKIFLWNCRGANSATFMSNLRTLIEINNHSILVLTETRMEDHDKIFQALDYTDVLQVPAVGYLGGISLLWRNTEATVEPLVIIDQEIHTTIETIWG
ncbi:hypothetical protein KY290_017383 [Solanum tuberosum]|uniref:Endonuclease/exonuclease/phosphatase domain-containing protein n=1 Tax=Solanum tuberosum TaxID=4113 RepID=A0ABQ7VB49_SOLTU|nr:hypothetical protein KY290_017383 [Solanum tuberosum]